MPPLIVGGVYAGVFIPTEAAGAGVTLSFIICFLIYRRLGPRDIVPTLRDTVKTTAMIFMIIGAADYFVQVLTINQIPQQILQRVNDRGTVPAYFE